MIISKDDKRQLRCRKSKERKTRHVLSKEEPHIPNITAAFTNAREDRSNERYLIGCNAISSSTSISN
jgi:hypothetical protein